MNTDYINAKTNEKGYTNGCYGRDAAFIDTDEDASYMKFIYLGTRMGKNGRYDDTPIRYRRNDDKL